MKDYDVIIIGSGPSGEAASILLSKNGKRVLIVEKYKLVGGGSTHWGTIPSKTIRQTILSYVNIAKTPLLGSTINAKLPEYLDLLKVCKSIISQQVSMKNKFYTKNNVDIVYGSGKFIDKNVIEVIDSNKKSQKFKAKNIIIATGSSPYRPSEIDFSHPKILDSDKILQIKENPKSLLIYGAGIIGVEYACMFSKLGLKLNLANSRERVLDFLDQEITDALNFRMRDIGIVIRNQESYKSLEIKNDKIYMTFESGKVIKSDYLLWAQGRKGNTDQLNLDKVGIKVDKRNYIKVDENYETENKGIYAVGDVVGWPSLASAAFDQGRIVGSILVNKPIEKNHFKLFPTGIYSTPEISAIGYNENELTKKKIPYEVGIAHYKHLAKAQILGDLTGMLKILFHRETLEILGIHCFGRQASEIIHIGQAIMKQPGKLNSIEYFINTTFNYPTMAEAYRTAALNGLNRL